MTITKDPRFGQDRWGAGTDPWPARPGWNAQLDLITTKAALYSEGPFSARPPFSAAKAGTYFWATDQQKLYYQSATAWTEVSPVGGGGVGRDLVGRAGTEGASRLAARADHTHPSEFYATRAMVNGAGSQIGAYSLTAATKMYAGYTTQTTDSQGNFSVTIPETITGLIAATATPYYYDGQPVTYYVVVRGDHSFTSGAVGFQARRSSDGSAFGAATLSCMFQIVYQTAP